MVSNKTLQARFETFKEKYSKVYEPEAWKYIEEHFFENIHSDETPDILLQVYSDLGLFPHGGTFYHKHLKLLKQLFPIDGNIVEIGSGRIPAFANLLAKEQMKINKGTITLYEPLLVELEPKYPNITLHKETFTEETDIKNFDLVVGIMPCEATESILANAIKNQKDFYVAMCGCVHSALSSMYMFGYGTSPEIYQHEVIDKAKSLIKEYAPYHLEVTRLKNTPLNYPILYSRR